MESIYEQMNAINDTESLSEKYNVKNTMCLKKLKEDYFEDEMNNEAAAQEFYASAEEELENHFHCTGAFLEPSVQAGEGGLFLFADDMEFDGSVDFQTSEEYVRNDDLEGFLKLCISSFTPVIDEELDSNMKKLQDAAASVKCKLTPGFIEYATEDPEMLDDAIEDELLYCGKTLCNEFPEMIGWEFGEDDELTDMYGSYCVVDTGTDEGKILVQIDGHGRIYNLE